MPALGSTLCTEPAAGFDLSQNLEFLPQPAGPPVRSWAVSLTLCLGAGV